MSVTTDPPNPLVVQPKDPGILDGAGFIAGLNDYGGSRSASEGLANLTSAGLSYLGYIDDPFKSLLSWAYGWIIEHVSFLREPLDKLAGNPRVIEAHAQTWQKISDQLNASAQQRRADVEGLAGWQGEARDRYHGQTMEQADGLQTAADTANSVSQRVLQAGALVGTVRSLIRDLVAKFLATVTERIIAAAAFAPITFGGSVAPLIVDIVLEGRQLFSTIIGKISKLIEVLTKSSAEVGTLANRLATTANRLSQAAQKAHLGEPLTWTTLGSDLNDVAKDSGKSTLSSLAKPKDFWVKKAGVQYWKQDAKANETENQWRSQ